MTVKNTQYEITIDAVCRCEHHTALRNPLTRLDSQCDNSSSSAMIGKEGILNQTMYLCSIQYLSKLVSYHIRLGTQAPQVVT